MVYKTQIIGFIFITFIVGFAIGQVIHISYGQDNAIKIKETRLAENYKFINPLLECDANIGSFIPSRNLKSSVISYINSEKNAGNVNEVGVYYRDLNNGPTFGINDGEQFTPASLLKVPLMMVYLRLSEKDKELLNKKVTYSATESAFTQAIKPEIKLEYGKEYTVDELITHMIRYSDNGATSVLYTLIDKNKLKTIYDDLGVVITSDDIDSSDVMTIKDYASFFRILYNSSYLQRDDSEKALQLLSQSTFEDGIVAGVPKGVVVAHKFGERYYPQTRENQLHDCGIIYKSSNPYLLCIMTKGDKLQNLEKIIRSISTIIYDH